MKYKFKAFLAPTILLIAIWFGQALFIEGISIPQCFQAPCEKPSMPLIYGFVENTRYDAPVNRLLNVLGVLINSGDLLIIGFILVIINFFIGMKIRGSLRKFLKTNLIEYREKYVRYSKTLNLILKLMIILVVVLFMVTLTWTLQIKNPKYQNSLKNINCPQGSTHYFNPSTATFESC